MTARERRRRPRPKRPACMLRLCTAPANGVQCESCGRVIFKEANPEPVDGSTAIGVLGKKEE